MVDHFAACVASLDSYRQGQRIAVLSDVERREQGLNRTLDAEDRLIVQQLLGLPEGTTIQESSIRTIGVARARHLLDEVLVRPRPPFANLLLWPYVERRAAPVAWLLERVEVGLTGINVVVRIWVDWPPEARAPERVPGVQHLRWGGFSRIVDDAGTRMQLASRSLLPGRTTRVSSGDGVGVHASMTHQEWWRPGVVRHARAISLFAELDIAADEWDTRDSGCLRPEKLALGPFECTLQFPDHWDAGSFRPDPVSVHTGES